MPLSDAGRRACAAVDSAVATTAPSQSAATGTFDLDVNDGEVAPLTAEAARCGTRYRSE